MEYTYSVARVRAKEASLLSAADIEQLLSAPDYSSVLNILHDRGYRDENGGMLKSAEAELWEFLNETADGEIIKLLRLSADYHNIKAAVKAAFADIAADDLLVDNGNLDKELINNAVRGRNFDELPGYYGSTAKKAMEILLRTQDGQLCDVCVDKALLAAVEAAAEESGDSFVKRYGKMNTDLANLKSALRCSLMHKSEEFIYHAVYKGGTLNRAALINAAAAGAEQLFAYIGGTEYSEGVAAMKASAVAFEKWCDDRLMSFMEDARFDSFSAAPVLAYAYAKKTELAVVRLILSAKKNKLDNEIIRERVRRLYV